MQKAQIALMNNSPLGLRGNIEINTHIHPHPHTAGYKASIEWQFILKFYFCSKLILEVQAEYTVNLTLIFYT